MNIKWSSLIYFVVVVALAVNSAMYWLKPRKVEVPVIDTMYVEKAVKPDTVIKHIETVRVVRDTVIDTLRVVETDTIPLILTDTIYVYADEEREVYESIKDFKLPRLGERGYLRVRSFGPSPADSIKINFLLDFDKKISYIMGSPEDYIFFGSTLGVATYGVTAGDIKSTLYVQSGVTAAYLLYKFYLKPKLK